MTSTSIVSQSYNCENIGLMFDSHLSTVATQVPQAAGGDPTAERAPQPEGCAHHAPGVGD